MGAEIPFPNLNTWLFIRNVMAKILRTPCLSGRQANSRTFIRLFLFIWIALLTGCGYQLVGKETHVPPGLSSVAIPTFVNQTFEPGIEIQFTQAFLREFIVDRRVKILDRSVADSVLEGVIKYFHFTSVSYDQSGFVLEYQTTVILDVTLKGRTGEILWRVSDLEDTQWYRASSNAVINEANKAIAIQQNGRSVAERLRMRFFSNF
jgi:outer membrane lipopolysaccharide assembly protein LptE/RlpB